jgi:hypothetical protein
MNRFQRIALVFLLALTHFCGTSRVYADSDRPSEIVIGIVTNQFYTDLKKQEAVLNLAHEVSLKLGSINSILVPLDSGAEGRTWTPKVNNFIINPVKLKLRQGTSQTASAINYFKKLNQQFVIISTEDQISDSSNPSVWQHLIELQPSKSKLVLVGSSTLPTDIQETLRTSNFSNGNETGVKKSLFATFLANTNSNFTFFLVSVVIVILLVAQLTTQRITNKVRAKVDQILKRLSDQTKLAADFAATISHDVQSIRHSVHASSEAIASVAARSGDSGRGAKGGATVPQNTNADSNGTLTELVRLSQSIKPVIEAQERSLKGYSDLIVTENAKLKQSLAESRADIKRFDETVLTFARLLFRTSNDSLSDNAVRRNSDYMLGRLKRYFERAGLDVILPVVGEEFQDELYTVVGTKPPTNQFPHMSVISVDEIGIRRGENILEKAKVIVAVEGSK